jgi:hypothetical protein
VATWNVPDLHSWKDYRPQTPEDRLLSHTRQCWAEFCDDCSISDPKSGFKNYLQHEYGFLEYLKGRDFLDDKTLGCYQHFFRHLAEKDLGSAPDEELVSPLGQLLGDLRAVEVNRWDWSTRNGKAAEMLSERDMLVQVTDEPNSCGAH